jgi:hypothetical protein
MERLNKSNISSSENNVYSTLEKMTKEFEVSTHRSRGNVNNERDYNHYNQVVSYFNNWLQILAGKKEFSVTEKYPVTDQSATSYASYFQDHLKIEYKNPEFLNEKEEDNLDKENGMDKDHIEIAKEYRCKTLNCNEPQHSKGYCKLCYMKYVHKEKKKQCKGCGLLKPHKAKDYCDSCYHINVHKEKKKQCKGCGLLKPHNAKGYCINCYYNNIIKKNMSRCYGCGLIKHHKDKGYCRRCYIKGAKVVTKKQCN